MSPTKTDTKKKPAAAKRATAPKTSKAKAPTARMSLAEAMKALEKAGSAQTKKTYLRHGAAEPLFGVSFATFMTLVKRIGVDHDLARALYDTGNFDARILAVKVADPATVTTTDLDRWGREMRVRMCCGYVAMLAAESPHASTQVERWLASKNEADRATGWMLVGQLAMRDEAKPDRFFLDRLATIEKTVHAAPNDERMAMNQAVISIGCHNTALKKAALAAAKKIGKVEVDYGDTDCKTPDAAQYIEKTWAHSTSKGFESPAAHERSRATQRLRC